MLRDLRGLQFRTDESSRMFCRKIPFLELVKLLDEAFNKFKSAKGWANTEAMASTSSRALELGGVRLRIIPDLPKVDHVDVIDDSMRMKPPAIKSA